MQQMDAPTFEKLAHAIRFLSVDAVEQANSGHPGMPLGMADIATVLWTQFLKHNPKNPSWFDRDRFVVSNGHGSMLLYALLHLTGYDVQLSDLKQFRQLHSKTPGHPEYLETPGVETTTGPLGQGLANAVGMALCERHLAARFNQPDVEIIDHYTYAFVGDGCLMEGVSHEACSLAGTLELGKLIVFYDANGISIDGPIDAWFTDDTKKRFDAYNWHVVGPIDGHDPLEIKQAILQAQSEFTRPSLIICHTVIGYGSCEAGTAAVHGSPLGGQDVQQLRLRLNWAHPPFEIPEPIYQAWNHHQQGQQAESLWFERLEYFETNYPQLHRELLRISNGDLPDEWLVYTEQFIQACQQDTRSLATRKASQETLDCFAKVLPELMGGSADLTPSNNTCWQHAKMCEPMTLSGNYIHYGVREFGMSAIMNGLALHGGVIPFGGTFLVFSDYARPAIRLAALMKIRVVFVFSHDSIGLGEDGPTHQPIEHIAMLRATPNLMVWRPADLFETAIAWQQIMMHKGPSCLLLTRQSTSVLSHDLHSAQLVSHGGYVVMQTHPKHVAHVVFIATGSEVGLAVEVYTQLSQQHPQLSFSVISMPCVEQFLMQSQVFQDALIPPTAIAVAIEAGSTSTWHRIVGRDGLVIGLDDFGLSAKGPEIFDAMGMTADPIVLKVKEFMEHKVDEKTYCN